MENQTSCLFCGSTNIRESFYPGVQFNHKVFMYHECNECLLNFNIPLLTNEDYAALYPVNYHDEFYFKTEKKYAKQLAIAKKYPAIKTFVDYGCGDAGLLNILSINGYHCIGIEYNIDLVKRLRDKYPAIQFFTVEEFYQQTQRYDCIHLGDVLEHMTAPNDILKGLREKLNTNGYLFVEGPIEHNATLGYWVRRTFLKARKKRNPQRQVPGNPYHTFLANRKNQLAMLKRNNLEQTYFKVYETGWPFPEKFKDVKSVRGFIEYIIAGISVAISFFSPAIGNRFYYIGQRTN